MLTMGLRRAQSWFSIRSPLDSVRAFMNRQIQHASRKEIVRLRTAEAAAQHGNMDYYCRLRQWLPAANANTTILELGCGPGRYVALLSGLGYNVVAADPMRFPEWDLFRGCRNITLRDKVFAEELPFADHSFDHVTCLGALLYFEDPDRSLQEIRRVLKPGGKLVIRTVNRENCYSQRIGGPIDPASHNLYTMQELAGRIEANAFRVEESYAYGYFPSYLPGLYWYASVVWIPFWLADGLSRCCPERYRVNNIVLATYS